MLDTHAAEELSYEFPATIDSTIINTAKSCRQKVKLAHIHHLRPPGKSVHLVAGAAFAGGLDGARRYAFKCKAEGVPCHHDDMMTAAMPKLLAEWGAPHFTDRFEGHAKCFENVVCALDYYLSHYPPLLDHVQPLLDDKGDPLVEFTFAIPLPIAHPTTGDPLFYTGRFDLLGHIEGMPVILDEKTTGALGDYWLRQWNMRGQFLGYCWACTQLGYPVRNVIVRGVALQKTQYNQLSAPIQYAPHMIERWYSEMLHAVYDLVETYKQDRWTYNFGDACSAYGGCAYQTLCQQAPGQEYYGDYEIEKWDPLHKGN